MGVSLGQGLGPRLELGLGFERPERRTWSGMLACMLLTTYYLRLTTYYSLLTTHHLPLTTYYLPLTTYCLLLTRSDTLADTRRVRLPRLLLGLLAPLTASARSLAGDVEPPDLARELTGEVPAAAPVAVAPSTAVRSIASASCSAQVARRCAAARLSRSCEARRAGPTPSPRTCSASFHERLIASA